MELYILDSLFRRTAVIDQFESLIWTERFSEWGDFNLTVFSTPEMRRLLPAGTRLAMNQSYRVMTVELAENSTDNDGRSILKLSGRSLEAILDDRVARKDFSNLSDTLKWKLTGTPGDIARSIFDQICRVNVNMADDEIPFLKPGSIFVPGTIPEYEGIIDVELALGTVYQTIKEICEAYDLGFRLVRNHDNSGLYFDVYSGNDRTMSQTINNPVVFSSELDNLTNISSIVSIGNYKNVAYVFHTFGVQIVTSEDISVEVEGFDRRVLTVDASDIELDDPKLYLGITVPEQAAFDAALAITGLVTVERTRRELAVKKFLDLNWMTSSEITDINWYRSAESPLTTAQKDAIGYAVDRYADDFNTYVSIPLNKALTQRGYDELAKNRQVTAFDGELPMNSPYPYDIAYQLGDLVEMRSVDGFSNQMRATEQIFVSDSAGERSYPTLSLNMFVMPDTWFGWAFNDVWETVDGTWSEV